MACGDGVNRMHALLVLPDFSSFDMQTWLRALIGAVGTAILLILLWKVKHKFIFWHRPTVDATDSPSRTELANSGDKLDEIHQMVKSMREQVMQDWSAISSQLDRQKNENQRLEQQCATYENENKRISRQVLELQSSQKELQQQADT